MRTVCLLLPLVALLGACTSDLLRPTDAAEEVAFTEDVAFTKVAVQVAGGAVARAVGSGHFIDDRAGLAYPGLFRNFSFSAIGFADGTAQGQWELHSRGFPARLHGSVECVVVVGNEAWFAGPTTDSDVPAFIGTVRGYRVVDHGEGARSVADQVSTSAEATTAEEWCETRPVLALFEVQRGNVQVK